MKQQKFEIKPYYQLEVSNKEVLVRSFSKHAKGRELTQQETVDGYLRVKMKLPETGKFQYVRLHSLVAQYCIGPRPEGYTVNHKDANKHNNIPSNLEYLTRADNIHHSIAIGRHVANHPTRHGNYKDGRTLGRRAEYKRDWYMENRERILKAARIKYRQEGANTNGYS